jgi:alcohol dehydrogenase
MGGYEAFISAKTEDYGRLSVQTVRDMTARYHDFCNLPITLSQAGVKREDFPAIARAALNDGAMIVNPKQVTFDDVMSILDAAY